jgi:hypothetical protein
MNLQRRNDDRLGSICVVFTVVMLIASASYAIRTERASFRLLWQHYLDQISEHNCVQKPYYVDGERRFGDLCVLPDGTILQTGGRLR